MVTRPRGGLGFTWKGQHRAMHNDFATYNLLSKHAKPSYLITAPNLLHDRLNRGLGHCTVVDMPAAANRDPFSELQ